jgi:hypothetical protein
VKEYQRKETSITYSKTDTEITNNKESEEEIKSPKTTLRNTNTNSKNKNKTNSADNEEDKTSNRKIEGLERSKEDTHEATTRKGEEKKKEDIRNKKRTTTTYDKEASNTLTGFKLLCRYRHHFLGSFFYGGISP